MTLDLSDRFVKAQLCEADLKMRDVHVKCSIKFMKKSLIIPIQALKTVKILLCSLFSFAIVFNKLYNGTVS